MAKSLKGKDLKAGRIADLQVVMNQFPVGQAAAKYNHIRIQLPSGEERSLLLTDHEIKRASERADKNREDIPSVSWLRNALD